MNTSGYLICVKEYGQSFKIGEKYKYVIAKDDYIYVYFGNENMHRSFSTIPSSLWVEWKDVSHYFVDLKEYRNEKINQILK